MRRAFCEPLVLATPACSTLQVRNVSRRTCFPTLSRSHVMAGKVRNVCNLDAICICMAAANSQKVRSCYVSEDVSLMVITGHHRSRPVLVKRRAGHEVTCMSPSLVRGSKTSMTVSRCGPSNVQASAIALEKQPKANGCKDHPEHLKNADARDKHTTVRVRS